MRRAGSVVTHDVLGVPGDHGRLRGDLPHGRAAGRRPSRRGVPQRPVRAGGVHARRQRLVRQPQPARLLGAGPSAGRMARRPAERDDRRRRSRRAVPAAAGARRAAPHDVARVDPVRADGVGDPLHRPHRLQHRPSAGRRRAAGRHLRPPGAGRRAGAADTAGQPGRRRVPRAHRRLVGDRLAPPPSGVVLAIAGVVPVAVLNLVFPEGGQLPDVGERRAAAVPAGAGRRSPSPRCATCARCGSARCCTRRSSSSASPCPTRPGPTSPG